MDVIVGIAIGVFLSWLASKLWSSDKSGWK